MSDIPLGAQQAPSLPCRTIGSAPWGILLAGCSVLHGKHRPSPICLFPSMTTSHPTTGNRRPKHGSKPLYVGALADQSIHGPLLGRPNFYWLRARDRGPNQLIGQTADEPRGEVIDQHVTAFLKRVLMGTSDYPFPAELASLRSGRRSASSTIMPSTVFRHSDVWTDDRSQGTPSTA